MKILIRALLTALALTSVPALAQTSDTDNWCTNTGVWIGTVGKAPVSFAFSDEKGRYYYGNNAADLVLTPDPANADRWVESDLQGKRTGILTLTCDKELKGSWNDPAGTRTLPIAATRFVPEPPDTNAGNDAFAQDNTAANEELAAVRGYLRARTENPVAPRRIAERMGPHRFARFGIHDFAAIGAELEGNEKGIPALNQMLRQRYAANLPAAWICVYWALALGGPEAADDVLLYDRVSFWRGSTVVIESFESSCGRDSTISHRMSSAYDTNTGAERKWPYLSYDQKRPAPPALTAILKSRYRTSESGKQPQCAALFDHPMRVQMWPEQEGFVVTLERDENVRESREATPPDCAERLNLSFAQGLPFLEAGQRSLLTGLLAQP